MPDTAVGSVSPTGVELPRAEYRGSEVFHSIANGIVTLTSVARPEATNEYIVPITQRAERRSPGARR